MVAWSSSMASSLGWFDLEFWWGLAALVTIMLLGHWQEMKVIGQARGALAALVVLIPDEAELIDGDQTGTVAISDVRPGRQQCERQRRNAEAGRRLCGVGDVDRFVDQTLDVLGRGMGVVDELVVPRGEHGAEHSWVGLAPMTRRRRRFCHCVDHGKIRAIDALLDRPRSCPPITERLSM